MKSSHIGSYLILVFFIANPIYAQIEKKEVKEEAPKKIDFVKWLNPIEVLSQGTRTLEETFLVITGAVPKSAQTMYEIFTEGVVYSRLRMNSFIWDYKDHADMDHYGMGIGGKLMFSSAPYKGLSGNVSFNYSDSPFRALREDEKENIPNLRAVQDTFNRYNAYTHRDYSMASFTQLNLNYQLSQTKLTVGRQLYESLFTSANDTKMIPNAFEGASLEFNELKKTSLRAAYFTAQKLRDHVKFHDVITFGDGSNDPRADWKNNDDSAGHRGLSFTNLQNANAKTTNSLAIFDLKNDSIKNLNIDFAYALVPELFSTAITELNYKIPLSYGYTLTPGFRYIKQIDHGGGAIGGASIQGSLATNQTPQSLLGYKERYTLNGSANMGRLVLRKGHFKTLVSYSHIGDKADLVAPWRAFPTGGYTRAMGQNNWIANTRSMATRVFYDFSEANIISGFSAIGGYVIQNFDNQKQLAGVQADNNVFHMDLRQEIASGFDAKFRFAISDAQKREDFASNFSQTYRDSYSEYRFELNYLF